MESILTVLFSVLGNGAMLWGVLELRERYVDRRAEKRSEREAYDGMLRMRYQQATEEVARREADPPTNPDPVETAEDDLEWPWRKD